jgi:hypothetical protein
LLRLETGSIEPSDSSHVLSLDILLSESGVDRATRDSSSLGLLIRKAIDFILVMVLLLMHVADDNLVFFTALLCLAGVN